MKRRSMSVLLGLTLGLCVACSDATGIREASPKEPVAAVRAPTPEEELGIEQPGVLDAAVAAWAKNNELGEYYEESQRRLEQTRGKLLDDYRVRKGMNAEPTTYTKEWLAQYLVVKKQDDELRLHILECYSRGTMRPLPDQLRRIFSDTGERRRADSGLVSSAPSQLAGLDAARRELDARMGKIGFLSWNMQKDLAEWQSLAETLAELSDRIQRLTSEAVGLSSRLSRLASDKPEDDGVAKLERQASTVCRDVQSLALRISDALGIAEGQTALSGFAEECLRMEGWMRSLDGRIAAKATRIAAEKECRRRVMLARKSDNRAEIAAVSSELVGFHAAMAQDKSDGDVAQKDVKAFKRYADENAFLRFKQNELPAAASDGADTLRERVLQSIPGGRNPAGYFENLESKAFKLRDDYEEKTVLAELEAAISR